MQFKHSCLTQKLLSPLKLEFVHMKWHNEVKSKTGWKGRHSWCIKVESQICSVKQSLIGLHKRVMSLSAPLTQTSSPIIGQRFFSSVPDGVLNLLSSFTDLKEFRRLHCVNDWN